METTFVISPNRLNMDFLNSLKKLFKHQNQLQISISVSENFNLLQTETASQHLARLEKCLEEVNAGKNTIAFNETELDQIIFEKL